MPLFFTSKHEPTSEPKVTNVETQNEPLYQEPKPEIRQSDFIDMTDPNDEEQPKAEATSTSVPQDKSSVVSFNYGMGMPIDAVYIYMERDWEKQGKNDALANADITDMETKAEMIREGLARRLEMTQMKYDLMITELESKSDSLKQLGLIEQTYAITSRVDICKKHMVKLEEIEKRLEQNDKSVLSMVESYKRGFRMGVSERTQNMLNNNIPDLT